MEMDQEADQIIQEEILDKEKVQKDLEVWAKKLKKADELLREVYADMNKIYMANQ